METSAQTRNAFKDYKNLIVFQKAKENSVFLFLYYKNKRLSWIERFLIEQLLKAATSIGANIAEGYGRLARRDYRRFLGIARGSALETEYWIELILIIRPQDKTALQKPLKTNIEVIKILTRLMKNLER